MEALARNGAKTAQSISDIAKCSDLIFTSLPSSKQVNEIALGPSGLLENLPSGATWFETSTSDLSEWQKVRDAASDPELAARLSKGMEKFAERITTVNITGFDWNCPKYITQRFDENEMAALIGPRVTELTDHIAQLEARLTALDPNWKDTT
jgi:hypothetical protein